ncbi:phosphoribosyl-AMP cyclohydrolase [uncultured Marinobacter sp.]|uniref:phosphoribosyl-AMP cyclohydrolase n=1 Tax=uncultured Marinobacter sp. TaxID=187379 RepID=UPI002619ED52|nr:phosphoribosyl-AMP cyclohydrolase [uncultured Marinobacter sp.]
MQDSSPKVDNLDWLDAIRWNADGLVPAIAQDATTGEILMMAWMNPESLRLTSEEGQAVYWSRSRGKLWRKGETSGHQQVVHEIRLDCDEDVILLKVEQKGGIACHTGRRSCFYRKLQDGEWVTTAPVLKDPQSIYRPVKGSEQSE